MSAQKGAAIGAMNQKRGFERTLTPRRHLWFQGYWIIYLVWFTLVERFVVPRFWVESALDRLIPFNEWFILPYMSWFFYMAAALLYFFLFSPGEYDRLCLFLFLGMSICLTLYIVFPNAQTLRPETFPRANWMSWLVARIYRVDTPTNVCPSIHCLNSIGVHLSIRESKRLRNRWPLRVGSFVLMAMICLSTMFIKQHSVIDLLFAVLLSVPLYLLAYKSRIGSRQAA